MQVEGTEPLRSFGLGTGKKKYSPSDKLSVDRMRTNRSRDYHKYGIGFTVAINSAPAYHSSAPQKDRLKEFESGHTHSIYISGANNIQIVSAIIKKLTLSSDTPAIPVSDLNKTCKLQIMTEKYKYSIAIKKVSNDNYEIKLIRKVYVPPKPKKAPTLLQVLKREQAQKVKRSTKHKKSKKIQAKSPFNPIKGFGVKE